MVVFDWERFKRVDLNDLREEEADYLFSQLTELKVQDESNIEKLRTLFNLSQVVMQSKAIQADVAMEELEKMAKREGLSSGKREQQMAHEIEDLKQQLQQLQRFGGQGMTRPTRSGTSDLRELHEDMRNLERANERLRLELEDSEKQLAKEKLETEKQLARLEESEREKREIRREMTNLKEEIQDYRHHMESQRETLMQRHGVDAGDGEKLREKNRQMNKLLEEIEVLEKTNDSLQTNVTELKVKLEDAAKQMDITTTEYIAQKEALYKSQSVLESLKLDREDLARRLEQMAEKNRRKELSEEKLIVQLNERIDGWKVAVEKKDVEIDRYRRQVKGLQEKFVAGDSSGGSVDILSKGLDERDKKIALLTDQVKKAAKDMEENTALIEKLKSLGENGLASHSEAEHRRQLSHLQTTLNDITEELEVARRQLADAESHAEMKDQELLATLTRMREYESGEYGLAEAVAEIKAVRTQLTSRDRQIENLTTAVNQSDLLAGELLDENEELRERLGLDPRQPLNPGEVGQKMEMTRQKERALNATLRIEIERLEEERVQLKTEMRHLAQMAGSRAAKLGMSHDDLRELHNYTKQLKDKHRMETEHRSWSDEKISDETMALKQQLAETQRELNEIIHRLQASLQEGLNLRGSLKEAVADIAHLEDGMKEVLDALKEHNNKSDAPLLCPSLEKLVSLIETKRLTGSYDYAAYAKSQLDVERGRSEQLRQELKSWRKEALRQKTTQVEVLTPLDPPSPRRHVIPAPDSLPSTQSARESVAIVNMQMIEVLNEGNALRERCRDMEQGLEDSKHCMEIAQQQMALLYEEHGIKTTEWDEARQALKLENERLVERHEEMAARITEFEKLQYLLNADDNQLRVRAAELSGHVINLRSSEAALRRRNIAQKETVAELQQKNEHLQAELLDIESGVTERIGDLKRFKQMATFKISSLEKDLFDSVPKSELIAANRLLNDVTAKYRWHLERDSSAILNNKITERNEVEVGLLSKSLQEMKNTLEKEIEKRVLLEKRLSWRSNESLEVMDDQAIAVVVKQTAGLEMQVLNERQRADHSSKLLDHEQHTVSELYRRNHELEAKISELTDVCIRYQERENELRQEMAGCVPESIHAALTEKAFKFEQLENTLRLELSQMKEMVEISRNQAEIFGNGLRRKEDVEMILRQQLLELQSLSDEATGLGQLQRQVVALKSNEICLKESLTKARRRLSDAEALILRLEKRCEENETNIWQIRSEYRRHVQILKSSLQSLQREYSGAVPIRRLDGLSNAIARLQEERQRATKAADEAEKERAKVEDRMCEMEIAVKSARDLIAQLGSHGQMDRGRRLVELHGKLGDLRLREMKSCKENERLREQLNRQSVQLVESEHKISKLESELIATMAEMEKRQLHWEDLWEEEESRNKNMTASKSQRLEEMTSRRVDEENDKNLILNTDSELSFTQRRHSLPRDPDLEHENRMLIEKMTILQQKLYEYETNAVNQQKIISGLKLDIAMMTEQAPSHDDNDDDRLPRWKAAVETLQARLAAKEESVERYRQLLHTAQSEIGEKERRHQSVLRALQAKLHEKTDVTLDKFKRIVQQAAERTMTVSQPVKSQIAQIHQLEDMLAEQDLALRNVADKLNESLREQERWRLIAETVAKKKDEEIQSVLQKHGAEVGDFERRLSERENKISELRNRAAMLEKELVIQKEANETAPSVLQQKMVEKLKMQMALKEKQMQGLSRAMVDLKAEMVAFAQETSVRTSVDVASNQVIALQRRIDDSRLQIGRLEEENLQLREQKTILESQMKSVKEELNQKLKVSRDDGSVRKSPMKISEKGRSQKVLNEEFIRWEERKKWQRTVDQLREKIKNHSKSTKEMVKTTESLNSAIDRLTREKKSLELQVKAALNSKSDDRPKSMYELQISELLRANSELEELVAKLQNQSETLSDKQNKDFVIAQDRITELETMVEELQTTIGDERQSPWLLQVMRGSGIRISNQLEKRTKEILPEKQHMREKVAELQETVGILNRQRSEFEEELENCRVREMDANRRADQLLTGAEKLTSENLDLVKRLQKEQSINDLLRQKEMKLKEQNACLEKDLIEMKQKLEKTEAKVPKFATMDAKQYGEYIDAKTAWTRNQRLHQELETVKEQFIDVEEKLRLSTKLEKQLMAEMERMKKQKYEI